MLPAPAPSMHGKRAVAVARDSKNALNGFKLGMNALDRLEERISAGLDVEMSEERKARREESDPASDEADTWECQTCTLLNPLSVRSCNACRSLQPDHVLRKELKPRLRSRGRIEAAEAAAGQSRLLASAAVVAASGSLPGVRIYGDGGQLSPSVAGVATSTPPHRRTARRERTVPAVRHRMSDRRPSDPVLLQWLSDCGIWRFEARMLALCLCAAGRPTLRLVKQLEHGGLRSFLDTACVREGLRKRIQRAFSSIDEWAAEQQRDGVDVRGMDVDVAEQLAIETPPLPRLATAFEARLKALAPAQWPARDVAGAAAGGGRGGSAGGQRSSKRKAPASTRRRAGRSGQARGPSGAASSCFGVDEDEVESTSEGLDAAGIEEDDKDDDFTIERPRAAAAAATGRKRSRKGRKAVPEPAAGSRTITSLWKTDDPATSSSAAGPERAGHGDVEPCSAGACATDAAVPSSLDSGALAKRRRLEAVIEPPSSHEEWTCPTCGTSSRGLTCRGCDMLREAGIALSVSLCHVNRIGAAAIAKRGAPGLDLLRRLKEAIEVPAPRGGRPRTAERGVSAASGTFHWLAPPQLQSGSGSASIWCMRTTPIERVSGGLTVFLCALDVCVRPTSGQGQQLKLRSAPNERLIQFASPIHEAMIALQQQRDERSAYAFLPIDLINQRVACSSPRPPHPTPPAPSHSTHPPSLRTHRTGPTGRGRPATGLCNVQSGLGTLLQSASGRAVPG